MPASTTPRRRKGTGAVSGRDGAFYAYAPQQKGERVRIGDAHDTRFQAERALDRWLRENPQPAEEPQS